MNMRHLIASMLLALSGTAMAVPTTTTTDLGVLDQASASFQRGWWRLFAVGSPLGDFLDSYTFELSAAAEAIGGVMSFQAGALGILLSEVTLVKNGVGLMADSDPSVTTYSFSSLGAGNYTLMVRGAVSSDGSFLNSGVAGYQGTISSFASAAPEPASLAMVLAGLVAIGSMVAARRKG